MITDAQLAELARIADEELLPPTQVQRLIADLQLLRSALSAIREATKRAVAMKEPLRACAAAHKLANGALES